MTICIVDTSVLLNILDVPKRSDQRQQVMTELRKLIRGKADLLLPLAAVFETGNHIAHVADGRMRRRCAEDFVLQVRKALTGEAPWVVTPLPSQDRIGALLDEFADHAASGIGFGDIAIIDEWRVQMNRWPQRRVRVWSLDAHLSGHDTGPR
jgi:hypothetical protein